MASVSWTWNNTRRLTLLLLAVVVPPAVALVWLGLRLLEQDRVLFVQRETERRDLTAEAVIRSASDKLAEIDRAVASGPIVPGTSRITRRGRVIAVEPSDALAWIAEAPALPEFASAPFAAAEEDESRKRVELARARYRALAASDDQTVRAGALVRLARLERRQGQAAAALAAYFRLREIDAVAVIGTPADLLARRMICDVHFSSGDSRKLGVEAQSLAADLAAGRWQLDRASWELAAADLERWDIHPQISDERIAISTALELFESDPRSGSPREGRRVLRAGALSLTLAFRSSSEGSTLIVVPPAAVKSWLDAVRRRHSVDMIAAFDDEAGAVAESVDGRPAADGRTTSRDVVRTAAMTGLPWSLRVRVSESRSLAADLALRRRLLGSALMALIILLAGGTYLLGRVVRRELAVARLQTEFVAAVSHEFRTPLTSLRHITELLQESDDMPPERRRSFYDVLADSSNRLHRLVESLLDFSRMEAGRRAWNLQPVQVAALVQDVVADFRKAHPNRVVQCAPDGASRTTAVDRDATSMLVELLVALAIPLGLDLYLPVPEDNPLTAEKIELGRQLFFDRRLSRDGSLSCASCHQPSRGFADGRVIAVGVDGRQGRRNAPALINRDYGRAFFWDARSASLEDQVLEPIDDPNELGSSPLTASARVGFPVPAIAQALSSFVRSILAGNAPFDRFINGDATALTADEQAGLRVFRGKGNCTACHVGPTLTDERTHNTGVAWRDGALIDRGAGRGDFKTPTLREVAHTAPYMHDGSLATLEDVVRFYDAGGRSNPSLDREVRPLRLTPLETLQLIAFLRTLSGDVQFGAAPVR